MVRHGRFSLPFPSLSFGGIPPTHVRNHTKYENSERPCLTQNNEKQMLLDDEIEGLGLPEA